MEYLPNGIMKIPGQQILSSVEKLYRKYKKQQLNIDFINWLLSINQVDENDMMDIVKTVDIYKNVKRELVNYPYTTIKFGSVDKKELHSILEKDRFVF